jgi:hypothetical protein
VISLRSRNERYPCYLSDLQLAKPAGLLEHWQQKQQLEQFLAIALRNAPPEKSFPEQSTLSAIANSSKPANTGSTRH